MHIRKIAIWVVIVSVLLTIAACGNTTDKTATSAPSSEAQQLYERARQLEKRRVSVEDFRAAEDLYRKAIEMDANYAAAYAGLARIHSGMVHFMYEPTEQRKTLARDAATKALEVQPQLGDAHYAMGTYWYWGMKQYDNAAAELEIASKSMPDNADVQAMTGWVQRRRGNYQEALKYLERAAQLDALSVGPDLGDTYAALGRVDEALKAYDRVQHLFPEAHYEVGASLIRLRRDGSAEPLRDALKALPAGFDPDGTVTLARFELAWVERRPDDALKVLSEYKQPILQSQNVYHPVSLLQGRVHRLAGRTAEARTAFDAARKTLEATALERPNDARIQTALGIALAGVGQSAEAAQAAERARIAMPRERDPLIAQSIAMEAAAIYAEIGQSDKAVEILDRVFKEEAVFGYSRWYLTLDPTWDKIRKHAGFLRIAKGAQSS